MKKNVLVLFGGESSEHDISLISSYNVLNAIDTDKYNVIKVGITKKGVWHIYEGGNKKIKTGEWEKEAVYTALISHSKSFKGIIVLKDNQFEKIPVDICFPVLHGKNGEDGTVQGLLTLAGIPFVGCSFMASSLCMDKVMAKIVFEKNDIPQTPYIYIEKDDDLTNLKEKTKEKIGFPCFVKPVNAGSSVGASKVNTVDDFDGAVEEAFKYDYKVLIEKYINCREIETAVLGNSDVIIGGPGEIVTDSEFYDYNTKYIENKEVKYDIPAKISKEQRDDIIKYAKKAYKALDCKGLSRIDFFIDKDTGKIYLNEINTIPGFTDTSMYPMMIKSEGFTYKEIITKLLELASL